MLKKTQNQQQIHGTEIQNWTIFTFPVGGAVYTLQLIYYFILVFADI